MTNNVLDATFAACSHPVRRGILERLAVTDMSVGDASRDFGISKPAISRHLRVLEEAGAITRVIDGRTHVLHLNAEPLEEADVWLSNQREIWERKFDAVQAYLDAEREERRSNGSDD